VGTLTVEFTKMLIENEVINREPILDDGGNETGWYAKPTVNVTVLTDNGKTAGYSVQFLMDGEVRVNGLTVGGAEGLTDVQLQRLKDDARVLYNKAKAVLNDLVDVVPMD